MRRQRATLSVVVLAIAALGAWMLGSGSGAQRPSRTAADAGSTGQKTSTHLHSGAAATASGAQSGAIEAAGSTTGAVESAEIRHLIALGKPIYCAGRHGDEVALTFDDGPGPYTRLMLAKLRKHHVTATFFIVGRNIDLVPGATKQERELGAVGDHTFTHPLLTSLAPSEAAREIVRTRDDLERSTGGSIFLFRPPYGGRDTTIDDIARANGLLEIMWTVDSADSLGANYAQIERNVIGGMKPGAIILMHENHGQTIRAMLAIFAALQRKHLRAVTVPQLLTDDPPSTAAVKSGGQGCELAPGTLSGGG